MIKNYYLGCPIWGNKDWTGRLFTMKAKQKDFLPQYARVFNTVEGNNTFYGLPRAATIERWQKDVPAHFRFCFKFPRVISHDMMLRHAGPETLDFFNALAPLEKQIGIYFLQLPPAFSPAALSSLEKYLQSLPKQFDYAVEVRHRGFFDDQEAGKRLDKLLQSYNVNRAIFDTGTLYQIIDSTDPDVLEAQRKKPKMPAWFSATVQKPFLRFVGHKDVEPNKTRLEYIAKIAANWLKEGRTPYIFIHSPGDLYAPEIARFFHDILGKAISSTDLGAIPKWPGEEEQNRPQQMSLF